MKQKRRKKLIELAIYSIAFLFVIFWLFQSTGCNTDAEVNNTRETVKNDTIGTIKTLIEKDFEKTSTQLSKLTGKNDKLNKEYMKLTETLVNKRNKIYTLIKNGANDTTIVTAYTDFQDLTSKCIMKTDSLLNQ